VYPLELRIAVIGEPFFIRIKIKIKTFSICWSYLITHVPFLEYRFRIGLKRQPPFFTFSPKAENYNTMSTFHKISYRECYRILSKFTWRHFVLKTFREPFFRLNPHWTGSGIIKYSFEKAPKGTTVTVQWKMFMAPMSVFATIFLS
jgi:hypothetical protein